MTFGRVAPSERRGAAGELVTAMVAAALVGLAAPGTGTCQTLGQRMAGVTDGTVRFSFAARPGVCGTGGGVSFRSDLDWEWGCDPGPMHVAVTVRDGTIERIRGFVAGRWRPRPDAIDLGLVPAAEAAAYFLELAGRLDTRAAEDAILPAAAADSVTVWPALLRLARDPAVRLEVRRRAVFWLGQASGEAAAEGLDQLVTADRLERPVREQAVFALAQLDGNRGIPILVRVVRTHPDPEIRRKAIFWLGQSDDPRALALFEDLLMRE